MRGQHDLEPLCARAGQPSCLTLTMIDLLSRVYVRCATRQVHAAISHAAAAASAMLMRIPLARLAHFLRTILILLLLLLLLWIRDFSSSRLSPLGSVRRGHLLSTRSIPGNTSWEL